ncbi:hypothetical protein LMG8526HA_02018 [Lactococcus lactis]|uniref:hypothetical protein n=1 Tax=Lactococcus lactis TaxID=1358 RepID=UPI00071D881E|nr:hypothetical protein [Lactococcus lactis]KSU10844.1 hypothetical protein LMG8526_1917 [Lactococcus lactis subsp. lactis]MDU0401132.1 hypothetical protein [Lactococcus lactis]
MTIKFDDSGIKNLQKNLKKVSGLHSYDVSEILNDSFINENTNFQTLEKFVESSGFDWSSKESFEAIPDEAMDKFVNDNSRFSSWTDMMTTASQNLVAKKLGF